MSGHSKWATIHRAKGIKDAKKGAIFTKLAAAIVIAVRQGGGVGDPSQNFRLRLAVEKAREANMPKENVQRAIEKGLGGGEGAALAEAVYEGFLPGGVAIMVETLTDNKLRTSQAIRLVLEKHGGTMGSSGSVAYLFAHLGQIAIKPREELELEIIDLGVDDIEKYDDAWVIYCHKDKTYEIKEGLVKLGCEVDSVDLVMKPITTIEVKDSATVEKINNLIELIEELDDVHKVFTNLANA